MDENKSIYKMKLHEEIEAAPGIDVRRVPGGWVYAFYSEHDVSPVFVPFDNEFMEQDK